VQFVSAWADDSLMDGEGLLAGLIIIVIGTAVAVNVYGITGRYLGAQRRLWRRFGFDDNPDWRWLVAYRIAGAVAALVGLALAVASLAR